MADAIFISYRRDDSEGEAGRLFDDLTRAFGGDAVFMDVAGIKPGADFRRAIEQNVASCGVLLAVIGPRWIGTANADGTRRLDDPNDFVALEIASAMKREVPVIPVLVHEAKMPAVDKLPDSLKDLAFHNSVELSHARWNSDVALLVDALKAYVTPAGGGQRHPGATVPAVGHATVHASGPVQFPAPYPVAEASLPGARGLRTPLIAGIAVAVTALAAGIAYIASRPATSPRPVGPTPVIAAQQDGAVHEADSSKTAPLGAVTAVRSASAAREAGTTTDAASRAVPSQTDETVIGTWKRRVSAGKGDTLGMLVISQTGEGVKIHAFGSCQSATCDWGSQPASSDGGNVSATFSPSPGGSDTSRTAHVIAHTVPTGLDVTIENSFEGPAGARHNSAHTLFLSVK